MFAFKILRHYLYGLNIDVFTDHKSLQYMFTLRQRRWLELCKDYDMSVLNKLGKANMVADALSCMAIGSVFQEEKSK